MTDFWDTKQLSKRNGYEISESITQIKFDWHLKQDTKNLNGSGLYMLMNMSCYDGRAYKSDMGKKNKRSNYAAEIVSSLILADINEVRTDVLLRVAKFLNWKPNLINYYTTIQKMLSKTAENEKQVVAAKALKSLKKGGKVVHQR